MGYYVNCPDCGGTGEDGRFLCFRCKGKGKIYMPECSKFINKFIKNIFTDRKSFLDDDDFFKGFFH